MEGLEAFVQLESDFYWVWQAHVNVQCSHPIKLSEDCPMLEAFDIC